MLQEIMGHTSITTTLGPHGHLYLGDTDRLYSAAEITDPARIRPDEDEGKRDSS
jgi:hypothetical protein